MKNPPLRVLPAGSFAHADNLSRGPGIAKAHSISAICVQLGERFRSAREKLGWSQAKAAREYGCDVRTIRAWEHDASEMPARALLWIERLVAESEAA